MLNRRGRRRRGAIGPTAIATTAAAATTTRTRRTRGFFPIPDELRGRILLLHGLRDDGLEHFHVLFEGESRLRSGDGRQGGSLGVARFGGRHTAESNNGLLRLGLPIGATKTLSGGAVPLSGFGVLTGGFKVARQFERNHRVAGLLKKSRELPGRILAGTSASNACGNLFPVGHADSGRIVTAGGSGYQQARQIVEEKNGDELFGHAEGTALTAPKWRQYAGHSPLGEEMARLRDLLRTVCATAVSLSLISASVQGASTSGFGTVVYATQAHIGGAAAAVGTTVFNGDNLETEKAGILQVRTSSARVQLSGASQVIWGLDEGMPAATLTAGGATFSTANAQAFSLRVETAVIRPKGDQPTIGNVTVVSPKELTVSCTRGALTLTVIDDTLEIPEGRAARVILEPESYQDPSANPPPAQNPTDTQAQDPTQTQTPSTWGQQRPKKSGKNRFIFIWIGLGAFLTAFALYKALESPDRP
jgi:hypothetical protein